MCTSARYQTAKLIKKIKKMKIAPLFNLRALLGLFLFCAVAFRVAGAPPGKSRLGALLSL